MSGQAAEPAGLPALAIGMVVACVVLMVTTNRKFGHQTFHNSNSLGDSSTPFGRRRRRGIHTSSSTSGTDGNTHSRRVFEGLPEFGVLEVIASFLSPAELVVIATVSTDFRRASGSSMLWRCHCERAFGASTPQQLLLGEGRRRVEHEGYDNHFQKEQEERDRGRCGLLHQQEQPGGDTAAAERRCRSNNRSGSRRQWSRLAEDGESCDERTSPISSFFRRSCSDSVGCNHSWREAFFRAHSAKPRDLLRELSRSTPSSSTPPQPPTPRPCIIILHGRVHDLTEFLSSHPGGSLILEEHAFTDATHAFERFFHSREARRIARQFVVWDGQAVMGRRGTLWKVAHQPSS